MERCVEKHRVNPDSSHSHFAPYGARRRPDGCSDRDTGTRRQRGLPAEGGQRDPPTHRLLALRWRALRGVSSANRASRARAGLPTSLQLRLSVSPGPVSPRGPRPKRSLKSRQPSDRLPCVYVCSESKMLKAASHSLGSVSRFPFFPPFPACSAANVSNGVPLPSAPQIPAEKHPAPRKQLRTGVNGNWKPCNLIRNCRIGGLRLDSGHFVSCH